MKDYKHLVTKMVNHEGEIVAYQLSVDDWRAIRAALRKASRVNPCARCGEHLVYYEHVGDLTCCERCAIAIIAEVAEERL